MSIYHLSQEHDPASTTAIFAQRALFSSNVHTKSKANQEIYRVSIKRGKKVYESQLRHNLEAFQLFSYFFEFLTLNDALEVVSWSGAVYTWNSLCVLIVNVDIVVAIVDTVNDTSPWTTHQVCEEFDGINTRRTREKLENHILCDAEEKEFLTC